MPAAPVQEPVAEVAEVEEVHEPIVEVAEVEEPVTELDAEAPTPTSDSLGLA